MALLFRHNGSSFVIRCAVVIWLVVYVCANLEDSPNKILPGASEAGESLLKRYRWWQDTNYSDFESWRNAAVNIQRVLTASNLVLLAPLLLPCIWLINKWVRMTNSANDSLVELPTDVLDSIGTDAIATDPGLLKKHSTYVSYHVPGTGITYPSVRTFYRPHPQGAKLPDKPSPIPLLVFIHGLGGSVAQFSPLLNSLVNIAPCLAVDLPGCGLSKFAPKSWEAYTPDNLAELLAICIKKHCDFENGQGVVLICHSMGCSLAALLASSTSPLSGLISEHVLGLVGICPSAEPPAMKQAAAFRKLLNIPGPIFDLWRRWDRRGGTESASVARFVGPDAEFETKKLQVRFNEQSRTPVWRRMAYGILPDYSTGEAKGGMAGEKIWAGISKPLFLVAGDSDTTTPPENVRKIARFLGRSEEVETEEENAQEIGNSYASVSSSLSEQRRRSSSLDVTTKRPVLKVKILPSPASHALLYAPRTARPLSAHIQKFLASCIDQRLSLGWQLQYLTTEGKWDVKNLEKWQAVDPVSPPIATIFRAMKTLREVDEFHSPKVFVREWSTGGSLNEPASPPKNGKDGLGAIVAVVDISHETPVYDPQGLEAGGIIYRKFPTVSKLPPSVDEVKQFVDLIDELRRELLPTKETNSGQPLPVIAVHCHYGFNRTGFFVVAYMVERLGWGLKDAIDEFAKKRPRGVRHSHFVDELWGRYWTQGQEIRNK